MLELQISSDFLHFLDVAGRNPVTSTAFQAPGGAGIEVISSVTRNLKWGLAMRRAVILLLTAAYVLQPRIAAAQGLTGTLIGTVRDEQGAALPGGQSASPHRR